MKQPRYTWWPWRILAMAVPVAAILAGVLILYLDPAGSQGETERRAAVVMLTVFGAGNGLLLGISIGDLGRSVLSTLTGAAAALPAAFMDADFAWLLIPVIVIAVTGSLSLHVSPRGVLDAALTGLIGLVRGFLIGVLLLLAFGLAAGVAGNAIRDELLTIGIVLAFAFGNGAFIGRIFNAAYRVETTGTSATVGEGSENEPIEGSG